MVAVLLADRGGLVVVGRSGMLEDVLRQELTRTLLSGSAQLFFSSAA
jgi:hypothetical protein